MPLPHGAMDCYITVTCYRGITWSYLHVLVLLLIISLFKQIKQNKKQRISLDVFHSKARFFYLLIYGNFFSDLGSGDEKK